MIWKPINHPDILPSYLVSPQGYIKASGMKDDDAIIKPSYYSTNGYDFMLLNNKDGKVQLFPIDDIIAMAYIPIPEYLKDKPIKVSHINGDTRDISLENLEWVEDIEEWKVCTYPGVKPDIYEVSSWGRVRNKKSEHIYVEQIDHASHIFVSLKDNMNNWKNFYPHRLICFEYNISTSFSNVVNHINGNPRINYPKNLEWVTSSQNNSHAYLTKLKKPNRKFDDSFVEKICQAIANGMSSYDIMQSFSNDIQDLTFKDINSIKCKRQYKWISDKYFSRDNLILRNLLSESDVVLICKTLLQTEMSAPKTHNILKDKFPHISIHMIVNIKLKRNHVDISKKYF